MGETNRKTVGAEIIEGLSELCEIAESNTPIERKLTVRTVELDLEPQDYQPDDVRMIRDSLNVSQSLFAKILAVSVESVESWEQGVRKPPPMACRLLDLIYRNREHWIKVLRESTRESVAQS